jgi:hypothetical protein
MTYVFRQVDTSSQGVDEVSLLLTNVFGKSAGLSAPYLQWLYVDNPAGPVVGFNAFAGDQLAAHYATVPIVADFDRRTVRGLLSLNTATHPDHQGKQLFSKLAAQTYDCGGQQGFEFVVGVANANSTPGFVRKLGFALVRPLDARVGFGMPRFRQRTQVSFERKWDEKTLRWRFKCPGRIYGLHRSKRSGLATVLARTRYPFVRADLTQLEAVVADRVAADLPKSPPTTRVWLGIDPDVDWSRSCFVEIPNMVRPSPVNLIFKPLGDRKTRLAADEVRFRALDFDGY